MVQSSNFFEYQCPKQKLPVNMRGMRILAKTYHVFCYDTFSVKGMITSDLIGLLITSSISCVSFILFFDDIEIKFDMIWKKEPCLHVSVRICAPLRRCFGEGGRHWPKKGYGDVWPWRPLSRLSHSDYESCTFPLDHDCSHNIT